MRLCLENYVINELFSLILCGSCGFFIVAGNYEVNDDAENECAGNLGEGNLAEGEGHSADTGNEDGGNDEEIPVEAEVNILNHLETADGDESVKGEADAAHYTAGDG